MKINIKNVYIIIYVDAIGTTKIKNGDLSVYVLLMIYSTNMAKV